MRLFYVHIRFRGNGRRRISLMLILYESRTGNVRRFAGKLDLPSRPIDETLTVDEPYVLITYTTGFGQVPPRTGAFLERNHRLLKGVAASGNRNWGDRFALSADRIAEAYGVPVIGKFELSGTNANVDQFIQGVRAIASY